MEEKQNSKTEFSDSALQEIKSGWEIKINPEDESAFSLRFRQFINDYIMICFPYKGNNTVHIFIVTFFLVICGGAFLPSIVDFPLQLFYQDEIISGLDRMPQYEPGTVEHVVYRYSVDKDGKKVEIGDAPAIFLAGLFYFLALHLPIMMLRFLLFNPLVRNKRYISLVEKFSYYTGLNKSYKDLNEFL